MKNLISAILFTLVTQLAMAAGNVVQNGDFEIPVAGPGAVPAWTYSGGDSYYGVDADYSAAPGARPGLVFYDGAATNPGLLAQSIATTAGTAYRLEFDLQRYASSPNGPVANLVSVNFGAATVFQQMDIAADWMHFIINGLIAGPGVSTLLQFTNFNVYDFNQLDNVSLVAQDRPNDVAEPATPLALAAALAAFMLARRRRSH